MIRYYIIIVTLLTSLSSSFAADTQPPGGSTAMPNPGMGRDGEPGLGMGPGRPGGGKHGGGRGRHAAPCYSGDRVDSYGACKPVVTVEDAVKRLKESAGGEVVVDRVVERTWFYKADILDKDGRLVDKVIIHKRSGRIRSIL
jgi:hypothetical protein